MYTNKKNQCPSIFSIFQWYILVVKFSDILPFNFDILVISFTFLDPIKAVDNWFCEIDIYKNIRGEKSACLKCVSKISH